MKRKRDDKDGREMRCYRHANCPGKGKHQFLYCPRDGIWLDDDELESTSSPGVPCPRCGRRGCKFV